MNLSTERNGNDGSAPSGSDVSPCGPEVLAGRVARLTDVQRRCLVLTLEHKSSKEIAQLLGTTQHSVDWHMKEAMRKLHVGSRVAAAIILRDQSSDSSRQWLAHQSPEVVPQVVVTDVEGSPDGWSAKDAFATQTQLRDDGPVVDWLAAGVSPDRAVHAARFVDVLGVPWGTLNALRLQQRLILILLIAGLAALSFGAVVASLEALRNLL